MELLTKLIRSQFTFFLLLAVIIISGCGSNQSQDLNELEFLQLCPTACWNGIQPGATNLQEAKLQIGKLESQGIVEVTQDAILETNERIIRLEYKSVGRILIVLDNDIVQRISVQFTELKPYYEVTQFITTFGNPQAQLSKNRVLRPSKGCSEWDQEVVYQTQTASSYLVNLDKGITALVVMDPFYASAICPDSKVLILDLYPPITLDKAYAAERPAAFALSNFEPSDLKEWEGYGTGY